MESNSSASPQQSPIVFRDSMLMHLGFEPTSCQSGAIDLLSDFMDSPDNHTLFLLNGYAGTGKTTLISAFVKTLIQARTGSVLLAPTGRAAKVLSTYAGKPAHTIHRYIYRVFTGADGRTTIIPAVNKRNHTVFIVDEVSMIQGLEQGDDENQAFAGRNILDDLVAYVYETGTCKMVFVGDQAQLPPVGSSLSPALDPALLRARYNLALSVHSLDTVVRQESHSGILANATALRQRIAAGDHAPPFLKLFKKDFVVPPGYELLDELSASFSGSSSDDAVVITRSNKRANLYNREIRYRILGREQEIEGGDLMMVVKNNYYWLPENSPAGFIANGDMLKVLRIRNIEDRFGFRFADALVRFADFPGETDFEVKILLDAIASESASISRAQRDALFAAVRHDIAINPDLKGRGGVSVNPWYNALQVKFAYALTCHKTQGGQWETVYIDQGYLPPERIDTEYLRWLYTAVTRASSNIILSGFNQEYLIEEEDVR